MKKLIFIFLVFLNSCSLFQSEIESVTDFLPRDTDLPGWMRTSFPEEFSASAISKYKQEYRYIGASRVSICYYNSLDNQEDKVLVEVIKFDSILKSYGFFSKLASGLYFKPSTKVELYEKDLAIALRGDIVIFAQPLSNSGNFAEILKKLVDVSLSYIGEFYNQESLPGSISILDNEYKSSLIYTDGQNPAIQLDRLFMKTWKHKDITIDVFFSERQSNDEVMLIFNKLLQNGYTLAETQNPKVAFVKPKQRGYNFIAVREKWIYGCIDAPSIPYANEILEILKSRISLYERPR
ncbi:MAG TPA: hypothetical protein P5554_05020 [Spirochaetota bacterium]|nr:hypothetical protein [Spirochaetota bacterium]